MATKKEAALQRITLKKRKDIKILSLDVASRCGWAVSRGIYGTWDLTTRKDESAGMKWLRFRAKLREIVEIEQITVVAYERAAGFHKSALIHEAKMIGVLEMFCEENNLDYRAYSATEIKKFATGKGNANKKAMITAAQQKLDYDGDDDNQADALWLLELAKKDIL